MARRLATMGLLGVLASLAAASFAQDDPTTPTPNAPKPLAAKDLPKNLARLVELHNKERAKAELEPLEPDARLMAAAKRHAEDMAKHDMMGHDGSDDSTMIDRVRDEDYGFRLVGENVAFGQTTPEQAHKSWMESQGHRKNILTPEFRQVGAAVAKSKKRLNFWCVVFGQPLDPPASK